MSPIRRRSWLFLTLCGALQAACSAGGSSTTVGPQGGTVTAPGLTLQVPAGALRESVSIGVTSTADAAPAGYEAKTAVFRLTPDGLAFEQPVFVTIEVTGDASGLHVFHVSNGTVEDVGGTVAGNVISAQISHFSSVFAGSVPGGASAEVVASDINTAGGFGVDDTNVAFIRGSLPTLYVKPLAGGSESMRGFSGTGTRAMQLSDGYAYYISSAAGGNLGGVYRMGVTETSGSPVTGEFFGAKGFSVDATDVYLGHLNNLSTGTMTISRIAKSASGGTPTTVCTADTPLGRVTGIVAVGNTLFYAGVDNGNLWKCSLPGPGTATAIPLYTGNGPGVLGLAAQGTDLYFSTLVDATMYRFGIQKMSTSGTTPTTIVPDRPAITDVLVDANAVYWLETETDSTDANAVWKAGLDGSNPVKLGGGFASAMHLRQNSTHVFALDFDFTTGATAIHRFAK